MWSLYFILVMLEESVGAFKGWIRSEGDDEERFEVFFLAIRMSFFMSLFFFIFV